MRISRDDISRECNRTEFDDDIILHELGHYVLGNFSRDNSPGGAHSLSGHYDIRLTWSWPLAYANQIQVQMLSKPTLGVIFTAAAPRAEISRGVSTWSARTGRP